MGNPESRAALLRISSIVEEQESLLGMSPHLLAAAKSAVRLQVYHGITASSGHLLFHLSALA